MGETEFVNFLFECGLGEMVIDDDSESIKRDGIETDCGDIDPIDEFFDMYL